MDTKLLIGAHDVDASNGATFERNNPVTNEVSTRASASTVADARAAADAAAAAFPAWSSLGPNARRSVLLRAADLFEVKLAAGMWREAGAITTQIGGEIIPSDKPGCFAMALRQPAGVVLGIAPWNAPVILGSRAIAGPLACGNTVVLKASEMCPQTHRLIGEILREAGLPAGAVNVVTNSPADAPQIVEALIAHPAVRRINFTGSTRVGKVIAGLAAPLLKPVCSNSAEKHRSFCSMMPISMRR